MWKKICFCALCCLLLAGCGGQQKEETAHLVLYSELEPTLTQAIVAAYNAENKHQAQLTPVYELKEGAAADLVLAEQRTLNGLKVDGRLQSYSCSEGERLAGKFKDKDGLWYGAFYDPVVFLVNQTFSRSIGQQRIHGWGDLQNGFGGARIAMENLTDNNSTGNFIGALADKMGEGQSLSYLWSVGRYINHYSKFPFTPVRMAAVGDADVAVTRRSYVFKYLESNFPAYELFPVEGTPVNLYGVGVLQGSKAVEECGAFADWLLTDSDMRRVCLSQNSGYLFLLDQVGGTRPPEELWLNTTYLLNSRQDYLKQRWLERVRFRHGQE